MIILLDGDRQAIYSGIKERNENNAVSIIYGELADYARNIVNLDVIDLHTYFRNDFEEDRMKFEYEYDGHWNERGHSVAAHALIEKLQRVAFNTAPEIVSSTFADWCEESDIRVVYIQKGNPQKYGFAERFNGSFRYKFLDVYLLESLSQVSEIAWLWRLDYNDERPHEGLRHLRPKIYW